MIRWSPEALRVREEYLQEVSRCVSAAGTADPDEVVAELREHIDSELSQVGEPVLPADLQDVLARLGEARQWIDEERLAWWRKALLRVRRGEEDWRLAYASVGMLTAGLIFGWLLGWFVFVVLLGVSFLCARATVSVHQYSLPEGQKWLVYPTLALVYLALVAAVLASLPIACGSAAFCVSLSFLSGHAAAPWPGSYPPVVHMLGIHPERGGGADVRAGMFAVWAGMMAAGVWWILLFVAGRRANVKRVLVRVFRPFGPRVPAWLPASMVWLAGAILVVGVLLAVAASHCGQVYL